MNLSNKNISIICDNIEEFNSIQNILFKKGYKWIYYQKNIQLFNNMFPLIIFINLPKRRNNMIVGTYKSFIEDAPSNISELIPIYKAKSIIRDSKLEDITHDKILKTPENFPEIISNQIARKLSREASHRLYIKYRKL